MARYQNTSEHWPDMTLKNRNSNSTSKSRLASNMTTVSLAIPKEWKEQMDTICGYGKPYETYSAFVRDLISKHLQIVKPIRKLTT